MHFLAQGTAMKTTNNLLNIGLFLLVSLFSGCASIGDVPHDRPLEADTPSNARNDVIPAAGAVHSNESDESAVRSSIKAVSYQSDDDVELEYAIPELSLIHI